MHFLTSDHVQLAYSDQGSGQPLLFLAGFGTPKEIWNRQVSFFQRQGFRVICLDLRNQGASQRTTQGLRMSRLGLDLFELVTFLKLEAPIIIGNSMGAANIWATMSLHADQWFEKCIIVDQSPKMINDATWQWGFKDLTWTTFPDQLKIDFGRPTYHPLPNDLKTLLQTVNQQQPFNRQLDLPLLIDHAFQDWRDVISLSTKPTLWVTGQQSPFFDSQGLSQWIQWLPASQSVTIADAGHLVMAEQPDLFNTTILNFIQA